MQQPLISIITPSYNSESFIEFSIKSVMDQTYKYWEMLIVDDKSVDNCREIINKYTELDSRIKSINLEKNVGAAEARNFALRIAKGKFIAFLDCDDIWLPEKLEVQLDFMRKNNYAFTFSAYQIFSEDGKTNYQTINVPKVIDYKGYLKNTIIGCLTVVINREKTGYFEMPNIKSSHDMALWLLIMKRGFKAYGINQVLAKYRLVASSNTAKKWKAAKDVWSVYRKIEKLNFIFSLYYFINYVFNAIKKRIN